MRDDCIIYNITAMLPKTTYMYILMLIAMSVCVTGCDDDIVISEEENNPANSTETEIAAHIDMGSHMSRTTLGDLKDGIYPVLWSENDEIRVFNSNGTETADFKIVSGSGTQSAVFRGGMMIKTNPAYSVYPSATGFMDDNGIVGAELPATQRYTQGGLSPNIIPMAGVSTNCHDFSYRNLCGIIRLKVKGNGRVKKIMLLGNDGEIVAGKIAMQFSSDGTPLTSTPDEGLYAEGVHLINSTDGSPAVAVNMPEDQPLIFDPINPVTIDIAVLPQTFSHGFTVRFSDGTYNDVIVKSSKRISLRRSTILEMAEIDYETPSLLEPANCYVIKEAGPFIFPAFCMGNRPSCPIPVDENGFHGNNPVGADWLWTDNPDAISNIHYLTGEIGYIVFNVHPDADGNPPRGNAVIALYGKVTKEILWSWHLWMSDFNETYTDGRCGGGRTKDGFISEAANLKMVVMDRNLGAVSANKADGWKTYGLFYQMGRKDPFPGACFNKGSETTANKISNDGTWDHKTSTSDLGTHYRSEPEPFTSASNNFVFNRNLVNDGWVYRPSPLKAEDARKNPMLFSAKQGTAKGEWFDYEHNNDGIDSSSPYWSNGQWEDFWNRTKEIHDPCPAGWTVLGDLTADGSNHQSRFRTNGTISQYNANGIYGVELTCNVEGRNYVSWWPAAGFRSTRGWLANVGGMGWYLYFDHIRPIYNGVADLHGGHGTVIPIINFTGMNRYSLNNCLKVENNTSNQAGSVRCVRAKQP